MVVELLWLVDRASTCKVRGKEGGMVPYRLSRPQAAEEKEGMQALVKAGYEETRSDVCRRSASC